MKKTKIMFLYGLFMFSGIWVMAQEAYKGDVQEVETVRSIDQYPDASTICIPHIVQWKQKHLVVAYEVGIAGKIDMGDIAVSISTNDGKDWNATTYIFNHRYKNGTQQFAYANPVLYKIPEQDIIWCFAMRNPLYQRNSEESYLVAAYSGDGGRSWNQVELVMHYTGSLVILGNIQQIKDSKGEISYLLPAHRNAATKPSHERNRDQFVLKSKNLISWEVAGYVPNPEQVWVHEGHVALGENPQELIMVMRTADHNNKSLASPRAWSTVSKDNGSTWSVPKEEPDLWNTVSEAAFGKTSNGTYYYIYNDDAARVRKALKYKIKPHNGNWSEERTFFDKGIHNSYPSVIEVAPGDLRIVWDSGTQDKKRQSIHYGKLKI